MKTVTDADLELAAQHGLTLVQAPATDQDREASQHPLATRMPEDWNVLTDKGFLVGKFRITVVDCIYASKILGGAWDNNSLESVADVIRWIAPPLRHVRTGADDGVETINGRERPRALTECGASATGGDYNPTGARVGLRDGHIREMCPACRAKLEAAGTRNLAFLPGRRGTSTPKQRGFLRRLLDDGAQHGRPYLMDARDIDRMSSREASAKIDELKALQGKGWKS